MNESSDYTKLEDLNLIKEINIKDTSISKTNKLYCPHCNIELDHFTTDLNCGIFRCGWYVDTYQQIEPHLNKYECDKLISWDKTMDIDKFKMVPTVNKKIIGCAKPFRIYNTNNTLNIEKCEYI